MVLLYLQEVKVCSPDYLGMDKNEAVKDFLQRIEHYRANYQSLDYNHDKDLSFIQIFNQGERFLVNKLAGLLEGFFPIQDCESTYGFGLAIFDNLEVLVMALPSLYPTNKCMLESACLSVCPSVLSVCVQNTRFCQSAGRGIKSYLVTALV